MMIFLRIARRRLTGGAISAVASGQVFLASATSEDMLIFQPELKCNVHLTEKLKYSSNKTMVR